MHCRQLAVRLTAKHLPRPTWQQFVRGCAPADGKALPSALGRRTATSLPLPSASQQADGKALTKWSLPQPRLYRLPPRVPFAVS